MRLTVGRPGPILSRVPHRYVRWTPATCTVLAAACCWRALRSSIEGVSSARTISKDRHDCLGYLDIRSTFSGSLLLRPLALHSRFPPPTAAAQSRLDSRATNVDASTSTRCVREDPPLGPLGPSCDIFFPSLIRELFDISQSRVTINIGWSNSWSKESANAHVSPAMEDRVTWQDLYDE